MSVASRTKYAARVDPVVDEEPENPQTGPEDLDTEFDDDDELGVPFDEATLTLKDWEKRDIPMPDFILGSIVCTTNRTLRRQAGAACVAKSSQGRWRKLATDRRQ